MPVHNAFWLPAAAGNKKCHIATQSVQIHLPGRWTCESVYSHLFSLSKEYYTMLFRLLSQDIFDLVGCWEYSSQEYSAGCIKGIQGWGANFIFMYLLWYCFAVLQKPEENGITFFMPWISADLAGSTIDGVPSMKGQR